MNRIRLQWEQIDEKFRLEAEDIQKRYEAEIETMTRQEKREMERLEISQNNEMKVEIKKVKVEQVGGWKESKILFFWHGVFNQIKLNEFWKYFICPERLKFRKILNLDIFLKWIRCYENCSHKKYIGSRME